MTECGRLVLSLFPGIGLLDRAFEEEGFCVVRGPDVLWGSDIRRFHPPVGVFDGIIGGPPCQMFSPVANLVRAKGAELRFGNLIPEFERCVAEAAPDWWLMENVVAAPEPAVTRYAAHHFLLCPTWLGDPQRRKRRFSFGVRDSQPVDLRKWIQQAPLERAESIGAVTSRTVTLDVEEMCELQGLPRDFFRYSPFTKRSQRAMIGNGVPMVMGRAVAAAVRWATEWLEAQ